MALNFLVLLLISKEAAHHTVTMILGLAIVNVATVNFAKKVVRKCLEILRREQEGITKRWC